MRTMKFVCDPRDFHPGLNLTVRKGDKWADLRMGDEIRLSCCAEGHEGECDGGCIRIGPVIVVGVERTDRAIPAERNWPFRLLCFEHEPAARSTMGVAAALDRCYGPPKDGDTLTWIAFWMDPRQIR